MLTKRDVLLAKVESTYNTDPTATAAANSILVENLSWGTAGLRMHSRPAVKPSIGMLPDVHGDTLATLSFSCEVKGPGAAYSASVLPEIDPLLRGCGFAATIDTTPSSESATYDPASTSLDSVWFEYYQDGTKIVISGAVGNVNFNYEAGKPVMANFTFTGHMANSGSRASRAASIRAMESCCQAHKWAITSLIDRLEERHKAVICASLMPANKFCQRWNTSLNMAIICILSFIVDPRSTNHSPFSKYAHLFQYLILLENCGARHPQMPDVASRRI